MGTTRLDDGRLCFTYMDAFDMFRSEVEKTVDCASRLHICKAVCCTLVIHVDRRETIHDSLRVVSNQWGKTWVEKTKGAYCVHNDPETHMCGVRDHRPTDCFSYDCSNDNRIWKDFDKMELQPDAFEKCKDLEWEKRQAQCALSSVG